MGVILLLLGGAILLSPILIPNFLITSVFPGAQVFFDWIYSIIGWIFDLG